jgi:acyl-CoA dehydrogenase
MTVPLRAIELPELTASQAFQQALGTTTEHADEVDRQGRFPEEALAALRAAQALSWGVPLKYGGAGAPPVRQRISICSDIIRRHKKS